jgi:lysine 2,3-aminomutase
MTKYEHIELGKRSKLLVTQLFEENPKIHQIYSNALSYTHFFKSISQWIQTELQKNDRVVSYLADEDHKAFDQLDWSDVALIRLNDYIQHHDRKFEDQNLRGEVISSQPFKWLWDIAKRNSCVANDDFFYDLIHLFRQLNGESKKFKPTKSKVLDWMTRFKSGLDQDLIEIRKSNKNRIITVLINKIDAGELQDNKYKFEEGLSFSQKFDLMTQWWDERIFHIKFAIRNPFLLQELMDSSLTEEEMRPMMEAYEKGIPFFINPYYLSLLIPFPTAEQRYLDRSIRDYIFYSQELIDSYGHISAWEKEDIVKPGEPNAAGWILPTQHNIHRRYPEVAIFIPDTMGRSCGGLCVSCQRMYDFQSGHLNFNMDKLKPTSTWNERLKELLKYYEQDAQLRDILITGGDSFMSANKTLKEILDEVYQMAKRKKEANVNRPEGKKYAELLRVRLGTRLPVYIPQRITSDLIQILADFKKKAHEIGVRQFVIQTHFVSAMEVTPEAKHAIEQLQQAGWMVTNQQVFTTAASRRGYTAHLRKLLNDIGVLTYYTFSVKGFKENSANFATNARAVQELMEEKSLGMVSEEMMDEVRILPDNPTEIKDRVNHIRNEQNIPFVATDKSVMNLPGVGKSLSFRVIGITYDGRRILQFDHDYLRTHSPIIHKMGRVEIIESKSIRAYLRQLETMGEKREEYLSIYGYSLGMTEARMPIYEYPEYDYQLTEELTNLEI